MANESQEIQENLFEWFRDVDDRTLADFILVFVYDNSINNVKISKLVEKFLDENGLAMAYINYQHDMRKKESAWLRSSYSERNMIEMVRSGLLSVSFNRFDKNLGKPLPKTPLPKISSPSPLVKLNKDEKRDLKMVIDDCQRRIDDLMEDEDRTRKMFDEDEANDLINERNRLSKLFTKVLTIIR